MESFRIITDPAGIATVWFDAPGKSVNTLGPATLAELGAVLDQLEQTRPAAVIFASAKPRNFIAGADLFEIKKMDAAAVEQFLRDGQNLFERIEKLPMPTIAAINGDCLGGGLELALACTHRIAADDGSIKIGLPEVKLGILPGFGGTVRLTQLLGVAAALPLLLSGKTLPPRKAMRSGIIDEVDRPEALQDAARRWATAGAPRPRPGWRKRVLGTVGILRHKVLATARAESRKRSGGHYPATDKIIDAVGAGLAHGPAGGFEAERKGLLELMQTDACRNLMRIFFLRQGAKKAAASQVNGSPINVEYAAVIGGGTMGAGIVHALIGAGIKVRLVEVNDQAVSAALRRIRTALDQDVRDGRFSPLLARHAFNRVSPTTQWDGLGMCDVAIEAVVENLKAKQEIFARLDKLAGPRTVLASNTSSLSVADLSSATRRPGRVIGLHFFNPVAKMPLVEIVRTEQSDGEALATGIALAARLGKTPVLVRDAPGFLVNRVLIPYLAEATLLAKEGVGITEVDAAMKNFGWPMGPFELLDEIGLDVGAEVLKSVAANVPEYAQIPQWMSRVLERGWLGKKNGKGFYLHGKSKHDLNVNPGLADLTDHRGARMDESDIQWRLMLPMLNESRRVLAERIVNNTDAIDLATVMGLGFPPFRGGLAEYARSIGAEELDRRLRAAAGRWGNRFAPATADQSQPREQLHPSVA
jgi:3-hydroxyacyl-CoA dehydrogenase/enoyl-CoA hydratase/3-hydroxybutyryl-CoA epimerase